MARSRWLGKTITIVVLLGAAGGGAWWYFNGRTEPAPKFQTVTVDRGPVTQTVTAAGQLQPVVSVDVSSQISGRIQEVLVDFNSEVKKGDVLARLDPATFQSALVQAENELLNAQASLRLIEANAARSRKLAEQNLVSQAELDQIEAQLEQAHVNISIRKAALESRKTDRERCTILAPIDGIVMTRNVSAGNTVSASTSAPTLFVIANDLTRMQIAAPVSEADIGRVKDRMPVTFTVDAFAGQTFSGSVRQVRNSPKTVDSVVSYETIIDVANSEMKLRPGMTANVQIVIARSEEALRLPNAAMRVRLPEKIQAEMTAKLAATAGGAAQASGASKEESMQVAMANTTPPADGAGTTARAAADGSTPAQPPAAGEERSQRRRREGGAAGGAGFRGEGGGPRARGGESAVTIRTIYRLTGTEENPELEPVRVRVGITDMAYSEIMGEVKEGDKFVTAVIVPGASTSAASQRPGQTGFPGMGGGGAGGFGGGGGGRRF